MHPHAPFSFELFATSMLSLAAGCITTSLPLRWFCFALMCAINAYLATTTVNHNVVDYFLGSVYAGSLLVAIDYLLLTDTQRALRRKGQKEPVADAPFSSRFFWGFRLWFSLRGVGWEHEPNVFRPRVKPETGRGEFVLQQLKKIGIHILLLDLASIYNRTNPAFSAGGPSLADRPLVWRLIDLASFAVTSFHQMNLLLTFQALVSAGLGFSSPQDWVEPFGYWGDAYTLRRFWSRVWHQFVRRCLATPGKWLARDVLGLKSGSSASKYTQLYTAFFLSSAMHCVADYLLTRKWNAGGSLFFFCVQPVAIMIEDHIIEWAQRAGVQTTFATKIIGYAWVTSWFLWCFPKWFDPMVSKGFMDDGLNLPISIILGITRGDWEAKSVRPKV